MVTAGFNVSSAEGIKLINAACSCMGTSVVSLKLIKAGSLPDSTPYIAVPRLSKQVTRRSEALELLAQYNVVVCSRSRHSKKGQYVYTYTVTGFGIALIEQTFGIKLLLMKDKFRE